VKFRDAKPKLRLVRATMTSIRLVPSLFTARLMPAAPWLSAVSASGQLPRMP
jgi:hypothetical protein